MTFLFFTLYLPVVVLLFLIAFVVNKVCDRLTRLERRCDDIDDGWNGTVQWPVEDDWVLDGLRDEAGDTDDRKRQQLESTIRLTEHRH